MANRTQTSQMLHTNGEVFSVFTWRHNKPRINVDNRSADKRCFSKHTKAAPQQLLSRAISHCREGRWLKPFLTNQIFTCRRALYLRRRPLKITSLNRYGFIQVYAMDFVLFILTSSYVRFFFLTLNFSNFLHFSYMEHHSC